MNITTDDLIRKFKYFRNNAFRYKHQEEMFFTKEEVEAVINNLEAVEKLKNEIKKMVEERLTETINKIDSLKQEKAYSQAIAECHSENAKIFNQLNLKIWGFNRGLY